MRVLLVSAATSTYKEYYAKSYSLLPNGILYIAAMLEKQGHKVEVYDCLVDDRVPKDFLSFNPDIVGFSVLLGPNLEGSIAQSKEFKEIMPKAKIVWGSVHPSVLPEQTVVESYVDYVVIGAGETGNDCVEVAHLHGALEIHQLEILPRPSLVDDDPFESELHAQRQWQVKTVSLASDNGKVSHVTAVQVKWDNTPAGPVLQEVPDSEFAIDADMVILAAGFDRAIDRQLIEQLGLAADQAGRIEVHDHATSTAGVFSAGDVITGPSYIVTTIHSGRKAARKIDAYLERLPAAQSAPVA